jgi:dihydroflavonol-4-reductase
MKLFLTGGTGFIGGHVARLLRNRGDQVVALVRSPEKAGDLREWGCELLAGDLSDEAVLREGLKDSEALIHCAAVYKVGIMPKDRPAMYAANVTGTGNIMEAALQAGIPRMVYVSTCATFGDTKTKVVDECYQNPGVHASYYDETKYLAHKLVEKMIVERKLPCSIAIPGGVYGPNDPSDAGNTMRMFLDGKLPMKVLPRLGVLMAHVEDIAAGILLVLDKGGVGEEYVLGGEKVTMDELLDKLAAVAGKKPPRVTLPTWLLRVLSPLGPATSRFTGFPPNLREVIHTGSSTYWASDAKARRELGYASRALEEGLRQTLSAEGYV